MKNLYSNDDENFYSNQMSICQFPGKVAD